MVFEHGILKKTTTYQNAILAKSDYFNTANCAFSV